VEIRFADLLVIFSGPCFGAILCLVGFLLLNCIARPIVGMLDLIHRVRITGRDVPMKFVNKGKRLGIGMVAIWLI